MNIEIKRQYEFVDYKESVEIMKSRVSQIIMETNEELLWFLNHNHIYTQGTSASENEILKKNKIKIVKTNRGGKTTYHGPGQRIIYLMINLNKRKKDIREFISIIESSLIEFLNMYNVNCRTYKNRVGIWVTGKNGKEFKKEEKIGAIGLRLKNWVTYHGLSFNINPDMKNYEYINACGLQNYNNTSMNKLGVKISENRFDEEFSEIFLKNLKNFK